MTITYHENMLQGDEPWRKVRRGVLTSSEMKHVITYDRIMSDEEHRNNPNKRVDIKKKPKTEIEKEKAHVYELCAQRTTDYTEPSYIGDDMLRGMDDELDAKRYYEKHYAPVKDCGFITNNKWGFLLGYSPDGLVGDDGLIEVKGRRQKFQFQTIVENTVPDEYIVQIQTGLLVSERKWLDFLSFHGGMHMIAIRCYPDEKIQSAIVNAATEFHKKMDKMLKEYSDRLADTNARLVMTERRIEQEMHL